MNLDRLLKRVEKPTRYIGHEVNAVYKELDKIKLRYLHGFPDVYEVGMSHLGSHILYGAVNEEETMYCERLYAPWIDMEKELVAENVPLFSIETKSPMRDFDVIGFTLQYELSYTNIVRMLKLGHISPVKANRTSDDPIIIAGGPCAYNPEPLADIIDLFLLGEGETMLVDYLKHHEANYKAMDRREFLIEAAQIPGVYVPELYDVSYKEDGTIDAFTPNDARVPKKVVKQIIHDMNLAYYPEKIVVPYGDTVHDRAVVEIFRGCTAGCRFCQAGMIYRPVREKDTQRVIEIAEKIIENTGYEEIALTSLSTLDHSDVKNMIFKLIEKYEKDKIGISLPSLRLDSLSVDVLKEIQKVRKTGLTFAPEAGSQRLRDVINKGVTDEDIDNTVTKVFESGWSRVKLYFMLGLPTEQMEDVEGIEQIGKRLVRSYKEVTKGLKRKPLTMTISSSTFVPKPFTPFQWYGQEGRESIQEKQNYLREAFKGTPIKYNYHDMKTSIVEAVFARGDRRLGAAILEAEERGCHYDGWEEFFKYYTWMEVFEDLGIDVAFYANRERELTEVLPWDHIDVGVTKEFLSREYTQAKLAKTTVDCRRNCVGCGINSGEIGGICG
ncbi:TIGR03960 family B12-binding radical SAM protein [Fusibacter sp. A1]|uniref:TIGR03960 family B12-binding radical SAM protein n=2 Tax=unclassified Fusibacter TaxID=2624464 RepID=UPI001013A1B1|nr:MULTISPECIES: TIGR03960 family B12-binding radical SAM protein [unclassified Fusibacter]NPE22870.1 TIGR03960 family B12-binding radical SAM protein [Fusibacter sp. A1]RXV59939.1 TIGR03960 family B12-binding radical SAM protein [Fusibacter sp. A1]